MVVMAEGKTAARASTPITIAACAAAIATLATGAVANAPFAVDEATIPGIHAAMTAGTLTSRQLVQAYLDRIAAYDRQGPKLNAVILVYPTRSKKPTRWMPRSRSPASPVPSTASRSC